MDVGEKITQVADRIYEITMEELIKEKIPVTVGKVIIDCVHRRYLEGALNVLVTEAGILESKIEEYESENEGNKQEKNE